MARQMSNVTKLERDARRKLTAYREEWTILQMELDATHALLASAYANHEHLPDQAVAALIKGLEQRLIKMKAFAKENG